MTHLHVVGSIWSQSVPGKQAMSEPDACEGGREGGVRWLTAGRTNLELIRLLSKRMESGENTAACVRAHGCSACAHTRNTGAHTHTFLPHRLEWHMGQSAFRRSSPSPPSLPSWLPPSSLLPPARGLPAPPHSAECGAEERLHQGTRAVRLHQERRVGVVFSPPAICIPSIPSVSTVIFIGWVPAQRESWSGGNITPLLCECVLPSFPGANPRLLQFWDKLFGNLQEAFGW